MENRRGSTADESALTKSAAWAWLERRSGTTDDRRTPEFDVSRTNSTPKPSRYKVEAMKHLRNTSKPSGGPTMCGRDNCSRSLLDRYEVERISRQLDYYIKSSQADHHGGNRGGRRAAEMKSRSGGEKKKVSRGFWLLGPNAVACGSSIEAVVDRSRQRQRQRRPGYGHVAVVEVAGCRPRQGIRA